MSEQLKIADDLIEGMPSIAAYLGISERRAYHLAQNRLLPLFKTGNVWGARKSTLRRHYERMEQASGEQGVA